MPRSIAKQTVLITGASSGIGAACADAFAARECKLVLLARRTDKLQRLANSLSSRYGVEVCYITLDMTDCAAIAQVHEKLPEGFQEIDILVNNAGLALGTAAGHEAEMSDVCAMLDTNVRGLIAMTKAIVPFMVQRNRGHVINLSSIAGHEAYAGGAIYCATKHAVDAYSNSLRHDLVATQIRVTLISPGAVKTEFSVVRYGGDVAKADAVYDGFEPLTAEDIADDVIYAATRPPHVQCAEIFTLATKQSSAKGIARHA